MLSAPDWMGALRCCLIPAHICGSAENSEIELTDNSLENLDIHLVRGTAIVEVTGADDTELLINITTPHTRLAIVRRGLYRVNVVPGDATELIVRKGRVMLERGHTKVKGGNKVVFSDNSFSVAKLKDSDKKRDELEVWSKYRAETLAQANNRLSGRDVFTLMASYRSSWWQSNFGGRPGFWLYDSGGGCYTFFPFSYGWGSPYGTSYGSSLYGTIYGIPGPSSSGCAGHQVREVLAVAQGVAQARAPEREHPITPLVLPCPNRRDPVTCCRPDQPRRVDTP